MMRLSHSMVRAGARPRNAFTMLELLIAVGLTSLLMIALLAALQQYFTLQTNSYEEIARQQIARSLMRQIARDVQSVVFVKRKIADDKEGTSTSQSENASGTAGTSSGTSGSAAGSSNSQSSGSGSSTGTGSSFGSGSSSQSASSSSNTLDGNSYGQSSIDPETVMTTYTNGLVGNAADLQLFISRPDRYLSYVNSQELTAASQRTSDLIMVRYLLAHSGGGGLSMAIADRESPGNASGPVGLARMEGDLFGLSTAVETSDEYPQLSASKLLAKEVSHVAFRYFDGVNWQETWDSNALNEIPKSIEIILTLRSAAEGDYAEGESNPYDLPESTHRMVVPIPVAEPFVTESAL